MWIVILCGVVGSLIGALINYLLAFWFGRKALVQLGKGLGKIPLFGKLMGFNEKTVIKWETFFKKHGEISTFIGRLIPGIRQYISFPAGLARMNIFKFIFFTALGAGIWVVILAYFGYWIGLNADLIKEHSKIASIILLLLVVVILVSYIFIYKRLKRKREKLDNPGAGDDS